jgi:hypothetical protein
LVRGADHRADQVEHRGPATHGGRPLLIAANARLRFPQAALSIGGTSLCAVVMTDTTERLAETSPRLKARVAGVFELLEGLTSAGGQVVILGGLVVAGLAVFVILICCAMQALTAFWCLAPLLVLTGGSALSAFSAAQLQALASAFLSLNTAAFYVDLVFFGFWCILTGYLIFRSTFLPRILGVLLLIDGVGWATYLVPPLASAIFPAISVASGLAGLPLMFWLIVFGLNAQRWKEQASAAASSLRA